MEAKRRRQRQAVPRTTMSMKQGVKAPSSFVMLCQVPAQQQYICSDELECQYMNINTRLLVRE